MPQDDVISIGCKHYRRKCRIVAPCCGIVYPCRLCHNEAENHEIDRTKIAFVECLMCEGAPRQAASNNCLVCGVQFAEYYCSRCKLWDDEGLIKKKIYHCVGCNICRIGPKENYFHCSRCCACYPKTLQDNHVCIDGSMHNNCPICLEDMFTSRRPVVILKCGHNIHAHCQKVMNRMDLIQSIRCPTCSRTTVDDPTEIWAEVERFVNERPMPDDIKDVSVDILCNDCNLKSEKIKLNLIAMKCDHCGSYNTNRV